MKTYYTENPASNTITLDRSGERETRPLGPWLAKQAASHGCFVACVRSGSIDIVDMWTDRHGAYHEDIVTIDSMVELGRYLGY